MEDFDVEKELQERNELKQKFQELRTEILDNVQSSLDKALESLLVRTSKTSPMDTNDTPKSRKRSNVLRDKVFVCRNSLLTDLWSVSHMRSAFNICTALFIVLIVNTGLYYAAKPTQLRRDMDFMFWCFGNVTAWGSIIAVMHTSLAFVLYPGYRFWANNRKHTPEIASFDVFFLILFILFEVYLIAVPLMLLLISDLSPVTRCIVVSDQARLVMKSYAFFRENLSRALNFNPEIVDEKDHMKKPCPEFQYFLYFLFIPTLVYRDTYPRTSKVHWEKVLWLFIQFFACIVTTFIVFQRFVVEIFNGAGREPFTLEDSILILSGCILVGSVFMFCGFYGFLHCWMNAFAEMLRFGDRTFYSDWWNCTSYQKYYRSWNTVVHDWIHAYLYRDLVKAFRGNQNLSLLAVFIISAIVHEYIIAFTLGFLYPIMCGLMVTFGVLMVHVTRGKTSDAWNTFIWWGVCCGWGAMFVLYSSEYYSRKNCSSLYTGLTDFVVPRSWTCDLLKLPFLQRETVPSTIP